MTSVISWYRNANDPAPVVTEFHPEHEWPGGQGIVGETQAIIDIGFMKRYGVASPDGISRIMFGWGEGQGNYGLPIAKALKGGRNVTHQELRDLVATRATRFEGFTHDDYIRLVGRPDPDAAPGSQEEGGGQHNPIWIKDWRDPRVSPERKHGDTWIADGKYYGLDDKTRGTDLLPTPLGTDTSGGGFSLDPNRMVLVQGAALDSLIGQFEVLLGELRKTVR